jgi:hypothetical protein
MTTYERTLIAHGISPEAARRDALANELVRLTNREHPAYGVQDETIYGGGGVEWTRTAKRNVCRDATASGPAQPASDWSRNQALPASTLSPACHLSALPSRQVVGSSPEVMP